MTTNARPGFRVRALGEVAIRCRDFDAMTTFYGDVIGLERLRPGDRGGHSDGVAFFRLGASHGGHVSVLALFSGEMGSMFASADEPFDGSVETGRRSSLHHFALSVPWDEQAAAIDWLKQNGLDCRRVQFGWVGWRGVFTRDPDGNTVELVAADPEWHLG